MITSATIPRRILIADRSPIFRMGAKGTLKNFYEGTEFFEAGDQKSMLQIVAENDVDLVIMDDLLFEPEMRSVVKKVVKRRPRIRLLFLSDRSEEHFLSCLPAGGIYGYINKKALAGLLLEAVHQLMQGHHYFSQDLLIGRLL